MRREHFNSKTLRTFRQVSRDVSGESSEPIEGDVVLFGRTKGLKPDIVSVLCGRTQKLLTSDNLNNEDLYHWINFLFVKKDYQNMGYGKQMVYKMEEILWAKSHATIKIQSASKAIPFFKKIGYSEVGEPIECVCSGSALFRRLQMMEKTFK